jgi:hypothetical protein
MMKLMLTHKIEIISDNDGNATRELHDKMFHVEEQWENSVNGTKP